MNETLEKISKVTGVQYSDEQMNVLNHKGGMCIVACAGSGKALRNGTGVLTDNGYVPIQKIKVGDRVVNTDGKYSTVTGVYPQGRKRVYRVTFSDGNYIDCCKDHIWSVSEVQHDNDENSYVGKEFISSIKASTHEYTVQKLWDYFGTPDGDNKKSMYSVKTIGDRGYIKMKQLYIPTHSPILKKGDYENELPPVDAEVYGTLLLISFKNGKYKFKDINSMRKASDLVSTYNTVLTMEMFREYSFGTVELSGVSSYGLDQCVQDIIENYDNDKRVAVEYIKGSIETRYKFMLGVLKYHSDFKDGHFYIKNTAYRLLGDIQKVAESLGMVCRLIRDMDDKTMCTLEVWLNTEFSIEKLKEAFVENLEISYGTRAITSIEMLDGCDYMTCISVDSNDHLYITEHGIVTHNTTTLCHLLAKRIIDGEIHDVRKLLVTTYSKAGSEELQVRVNDLLENMGIYTKVQIRTIHSMYYQILKRITGRNPNVDTKKAAGALYQAVKECKQAREQGVFFDDEDIRTLGSIFSYQLNNLMSDETVYNDSVFTLDISLDVYKALREGFYANKKKAGVKDYDDLQWDVYVLMMQHPEIREQIANIWDYFYIDEFQDVSKLQYAILKMMLRYPDKLVVIGDDDQCIYEWRGADPNIILNICGTYDIARFFLSTNYRCAGEIVERANTGIKNNTRRYEKEMKPYNEGGKITIVPSQNESYYDMAYKVLEKIRHLLRDGASPEEISVLCRNNAHGAILDALLHEEGSRGF